MMTHLTSPTRSLLYFVALLLGTFLIPGPGWADETAGDDALSAIGLDLEAARALPPAQRSPALESVVEAMNRVLKDGIEKDRKAAARFLAGDMHYLLEDYETAHDEYRNATKDPKKNPFADDAALAAITALEAAGHDEDAAKSWRDWEKKHPHSPLRAEARLARAANAMRRGDLGETGRLLLSIPDEFPWMEADTRFVLTGATAAYLDGRTRDAMQILERGGSGAPETYLRALCMIAEGDVLKAAAKFQETTERFPHSPLRDYAMLAKANTFLTGKAYRSAAEEFARVVELASRPEVRAEAELRHAASLFLADDQDAGREYLREVAATHFGTGVAARAQFLLGEALFTSGHTEDAILEFNRVLTDYFEHELAASAQYRVGQCLDALSRQGEATSTYQAVVSGYSQSVEAPAAAYLAGVGLMEQERHLAAVPYFQLVIDRYALSDSTGAIDFRTPEHQELVEASLCLLELSYHRSGNLGQLSGMPHLMLQRMPPSQSPWRANALLIDADALAAQGRFEDAQGVLERIMAEFPDHGVSVHANRLLAWTYARQGKDELAIATEEQMLSRYAASGDERHLASAYLNKAHVLFNRKNYREAVAAYDDYLSRFPSHPNHLLALYQSGMCHLRLDQAGNAADRWETLVSLEPGAPIAEQAWLRAADLYFQAEHYEDAERCYQGLLDNFAGAATAATTLLRLAQCQYNGGNDAEALSRFSAVAERFPGTPEAMEAERGIEMALYRLGQDEDGTAVLAELVERYPTSSFAADAQFRIAMQHYQAKDYLVAAEEFRRVITQFPGFSAADQAYFLMGDCYENAASIEDAELAYEQFLMFFGDSDLRPSVQFRLGMIRFAGGDYMRAAIDFTSVLDASPSNEMASASLFNLALCHRMLSQNAEAITLLDRYRLEFPGDERASEIAYQLSDIHEQAGETDLAARELEAALAANPDATRRAELHYRKGLHHERLGDMNSALASYQSALKGKDKKNAFRLSAVARVAAIYEQQGKDAEALVAYRDLIRNATDPELIAAAEERASQLNSTTR